MYYNFRITTGTSSNASGKENLTKSTSYQSVDVYPNCPARGDPNIYFFNVDIVFC